MSSFGIPTGLDVALTGHRPSKLGGYEWWNPTAIKVQQWLTAVLNALQPARVYSGMALGFDQWGAQICVDLGIPFVAALPCAGQDSKWPADSRKRYRELLKKAESVELVSSGSYAAWKMQRRNEWVVDRTRVLVACWDGSDGGTANCVRYAREKFRPIVRLDPKLWEMTCQTWQPPPP